MMSKSVAGAARADAKRSGAETEYKEVCNNLRFYGDLRFKQLTIYLVLNGGLVTALTSSSCRVVPNWVAAMVGICFSFLFWVIERSSNRYWDSLFARAKALEEELQLQQYSTIRRGTSIFSSAVSATHLIYWLVAASWLLLLAWPVVAVWLLSLPTSVEAAWLILIPWLLAAAWLLSRLKWPSSPRSRRTQNQ